MVTYELANTGAFVSRNIEGQTYIRVKDNEPFVFPSNEYIRACCKTIYLSRKLFSPYSTPSNEIGLNIINGTDRTKQGKVTLALSNEDLTNL